jgi:FtsP/CotA-like multicopper oxidase with cupredoxin domain
MRKPVVIGIIVLVLLVGGSYILLRGKSSDKTSSGNASTQTSSGTASPTSSTNDTPATTQPASTSSATNVTITANDSSATPETINAKSGQAVTINFKVSTSGTYHGGLDFKSTDPAIDSGSIDEGSSKTVTFTATKSFAFTPYWYQSNIKKDYLIHVNVQ